MNLIDDKSILAQAVEGLSWELCKWIMLNEVTSKIQGKWCKWVKRKFQPLTPLAHS